MAQRRVIYREDWGIYLGNCIGFGFWTKMDPCGQDAAVAFDSVEQARTHVKSWDKNNDPDKYQYVPVLIDNESHYASITECICAGLPGWDPEEEVE